MYIEPLFPNSLDPATTQGWREKLIGRERWPSYLDELTRTRHGQRISARTVDTARARKTMNPDGGDVLIDDMHLRSISLGPEGITLIVDAESRHLAHHLATPLRIAEQRPMRPSQDALVLRIDTTDCRTILLRVAPESSFPSS